MKNNMKTSELYNLNHTQAKPLLEKTEYPWEALKSIGDFIIDLGNSLSLDEYDKIGENVWVSKTAEIFPNNYIAGPAIIGHNTDVRPGAFIRGNAIVGENCVVGNSTELKNVIIFDNVQVPHYNYVGDSVLGYKSHMGAGAVTSNVKQDKTLISVDTGTEKIETNQKKFGAMLGDNVEIGCNTVLNPGTVIGQNSRVYPLSMVRGFVPANTIHKNSGEMITIV